MRTIAFETKTLLFIAFTSEIQLPVMISLIKLIKHHSHDSYLLCLVLIISGQLPRPAWKSEGKMAYENRDRDGSSEGNRTRANIWTLFSMQEETKVGFRQHSDQLPSIFIISFARPIRAPKAELLGFCKICLKGTAVKSGEQDEAAAYDQRVKSHEKKIEKNRNNHK